MSEDKNRIGLTFEDYKCPKCHNQHTSGYVTNKRPIKCRRCGYKFKQAIALST